VNHVVSTKVGSKHLFLVKRSCYGQRKFGIRFSKRLQQHRHKATAAGLKRLDRTTGVSGDAVVDREEF
jgi:hypothetical protein